MILIQIQKLKYKQDTKLIYQNAFVAIQQINRYLLN